MVKPQEPAKSINPYVEILNLDPAACPPDYYALLGLPRYSSDRNQIEVAATERIRYVRPFCARYPSEGTQLLNEITKAKLCLLDDEERAVYDTRLRQSENIADAEQSATVAEDDDRLFADFIDAVLQDHVNNGEDSISRPQLLPPISKAHRRARFQYRKLEYVARWTRDNALVANTLLFVAVVTVAALLFVVSYSRDSESSNSSTAKPADENDDRRIGDLPGPNVTPSPPIPDPNPLDPEPKVTAYERAIQRAKDSTGKEKLDALLDARKLAENTPDRERVVQEIRGFLGDSGETSRLDSQILFTAFDCLLEDNNFERHNDEDNLLNVVRQRGLFYEAIDHFGEKANSDPNQPTRRVATVLLERLHKETLGELQNPDASPEEKQRFYTAALKSAADARGQLDVYQAAIADRALLTEWQPQAVTGLVKSFLSHAPESQLHLSHFLPASKIVSNGCEQIICRALSTILDGDPSAAAPWAFLNAVVVATIQDVSIRPDTIRNGSRNSSRYEQVLLRVGDLPATRRAVNSYYFGNKDQRGDLRDAELYNVFKSVVRTTSGESGRWKLIKDYIGECGSRQRNPSDTHFCNVYISAVRMDTSGHARMKIIKECIDRWNTAKFSFSAAAAELESTRPKTDSEELAITQMLTVIYYQIANGRLDPHIPPSRRQIAKTRYQALVKNLQMLLEPVRWYEFQLFFESL